MYWFAARPASLVILLVSVWLRPTVRRADKVKASEVVARALEPCGRQMIRWSAESQRSESVSSPEARAFNSVIDDVVGAPLFGLVVNEPGSNDPMLRAFLAGAAPGIGGVNFGIASDCPPRPAEDGNFDVRGRVDDRDPRGVCKEPMSVWQVPEDECPRGNRYDCARSVSGCPIRLSVGGVGGNHFFGYDAGTCVAGFVEMWDRRPPQCQFGGNPRGGCAWLP